MQRNRILGVSAVLLLGCGSLFAATNYGTIKVTVLNDAGAAIPGATVEATSPTSIGTRSQVTDSSGEARLNGLVPGLYSVNIALEAFIPSTRQVRVSQNEVSTVEAKLSISSRSETITVLAGAPIVETRNARISDHLTLERVEALPVSRDYKGWAQLVSGVNVVPNSGVVDTQVDPAGKGGNNYSEGANEGRTGKTGSRDNQYYLDGFNITDMGDGRGTMTLNNDVFLEQEIITSGLPAEYAGGKGFVGNIVTRSGGNDFSGSINYHLQTSAMYEDFRTTDSRLLAPVEDKSDAAITFGGPIVRDRMWFFLSAQRRESSDDIELSTSATPTPRTIEHKLGRESYFGKFTLRPGERDTLVAQYFTDPRTEKGSRNVNLVPNRHSVIDDTPSVAVLMYQHIFSSAILIDARVGTFERSNEQSPQYPEFGPRNTIRFGNDHAGETIPAYERDLGAFSSFLAQVQKKLQGDLAGTFFFDAAGSHTFKAGYQYNKWRDETSSRLIGGVSLTSLANEYAGITLQRSRDLGIFSAGEYNFALNALRRVTADSPDYRFFQMVDANRDGIITAAEFGAMTFSAANAQGINFLRTQNLSIGVNNVTQNSNIVYLQDDWVMGAFAVNAGLRMEDYKYIASDHSTILDMDPTFSPRLGLSYDVGGQGRQKVSFFYGKYYDPILMDIVHFGGNVSGTVNAEQLFLGDDFFTYRLRGSASTRDAGFAPNLENPTQEEFALTWGVNLSPTTGFTAQAFHRREDDMIDDYNPHAYFAILGGEAAGTFLEIDPSEFGYPPEGPGNVNFFVANLIGAKRRTNGVDLALERRFVSSWAGSVQYSWRDAKGNTNSDASANLQGDVLDVDPRQPYMFGKLPGSSDHQVKLYGMYETPFKLQVGALAYWNSGAHYTESDIFLPGITTTFLNHDRDPSEQGKDFTTTGAEKHPSWYNVDARLGYPVTFGGDVGVNLTLTIYNLTNNQGTLYVEQAHNEPEFKIYGQPRALLEPRRYQIGARLTF